MYESNLNWFKRPNRSAWLLHQMSDQVLSGDASLSWSSEKTVQKIAASFLGRHNWSKYSVTWIYLDGSVFQPQWNNFQLCCFCSVWFNSSKSFHAISASTVDTSDRILFVSFKLCYKILFLNYILKSSASDVFGTFSPYLYVTTSWSPMEQTTTNPTCC